MRGLIGRKDHGLGSTFILMAVHLLWARPVLGSKGFEEWRPFALGKVTVHEEG